MPVIEYKLIRTKEGNEVPPYVKNGGHWRNPEDFTMIGWVEPEPRRYYVPDTILELDSAAFQLRGMHLHMNNPFMHSHNPEFDSEGSITYMDSAEVTIMLNDWYNQFVSDNS